MYIQGAIRDAEGVTVASAVTLVSIITVNENGIIFTASSYREPYGDISAGLTVPFRAWNYFCQTSGENTDETAYRYLLTMDEFSENNIAP
ncbi:hypothetical protein [Raoultella planticola]|uniref:hypothetical protein n=1 Tax=Raoultella planticola TaxID=575 RepID=UPI002147439A|nr:hypothetical protein [Raoultella planticola]